MIPASFGSKASISPSATAVVMLIQRICTGKDRQRRPDEDGSENDQSLAHVGRQGPDDELREVVEDAASFLDRRLDRGEVVVGEHHVGRFLRHLGAPVAHGNADVGLSKRGRVVDPVTRHGHHVVSLLQCTHEAQLLLGRHPGEDVSPLDLLGEIVVVDLIELVPLTDNDDHRSRSRRPNARWPTLWIRDRR